ncbi:MAG: hypothetical protein AAFX87_08710 [Bacteroidota bacterium]
MSKLKGAVSKAILNGHPDLSGREIYLINNQHFKSREISPNVEMTGF